MAEKTSPYTDQDRERWRQALLKKGKEVSDKLAQILGGKDASLADFKLYKDDEPAESKERRLRRYFDHVMARLRAVNDPRFGYDPDRGDFVSVVELDEVPWLDVEP